MIYKTEMAVLTSPDLAENQKPPFRRLFLSQVIHLLNRLPRLSPSPQRNYGSDTEEYTIPDSAYIENESYPSYAEEYDNDDYDDIPNPPNYQQPQRPYYQPTQPAPQSRPRTNTPKDPNNVNPNPKEDLNHHSNAPNANQDNQMIISVNPHAPKDMTPLPLAGAEEQAV